MVAPLIPRTTTIVLVLQHRERGGTGVPYKPCDPAPDRAIGSHNSRGQLSTVLRRNVKQRFVARCGAVIAGSGWIGLSYLLGIYFRISPPTARITEASEWCSHSAFGRPGPPWLF